MIELIFVIVILGILAAVAIPKMAATRDDAKITSLATAVQSAVSEIPQYVTAKGGDVNQTDLTAESQVLKQLVDSDKAKEEKGSGQAHKNIVKIYDGSTTVSTSAPCIKLETNATHLQLEADATNDSTICKGIKSIVKDANYSIAGSSITY